MKTTKKSMVLERLEEGYGVTSMYAFEHYKLTRLSAVIFDLKKDGYNIETIRKTAKDGTSYAEYRLKEA